MHGRTLALTVFPRKHNRESADHLSLGITGRSSSTRDLTCALARLYGDAEFAVAGVVRGRTQARFELAPEHTPPPIPGHGHDRNRGRFRASGARPPIWSIGVLGGAVRAA